MDAETLIHQFPGYYFERLQSYEFLKFKKTSKFKSAPESNGL